MPYILPIAERTNKMTKELIEISMAEEELEDGEGKILIDIPEQNYT